MANLGVPNENESNSVEARQELDLKVGCAFTRFQTQNFQGKFGDLDSSLISYGPCQTPTLQFCVKRHDDIQTFQPEVFYTLNVTIQIGEREICLEWGRGRGRVFDQIVACTFKQIVNEGGNPAVVSQVREKLERYARPQALNTVAMLKDASQCLGMGPHQAMQVAERLYLSGFITYPRTETNKYPKSFDLKGVAAEQQSHPIWGKYTQELMRVKK